MPTPTTVQARFQVRADTAANWTSANPTLLLNELGFETDTKKLKMGDGTTAWSSLAYFPSIVSGGTVLGNLEIGTTGTLTFEGSTADGFETTLTVVNPTADRTITLPNVTGTVVTTGDTGTVTSTMIADGTIVNGDINASAAIAGTKISPDFGSQNTTTTGTSTAASFIPTSSTAPTNGVYLPAANTLAISTNGSERLRADSSGRVGIGTTAPNALLEVSAGTATGTNGVIRIAGTNTNGSASNFCELAATQDVDLTSSALTFSTRLSGTLSEKARVDKNGRLLVGTSTARSNFSNSTLAPLVQVEGANSNDARLQSLTYGFAGTDGPVFAFGKHRSASIGGTTLVSSDDQTGWISFQGSDGTEFVEAASIRGFVDGTPGANDMPGRIVLSTTADGASSPTEALRITNDRVIAYNQGAPAAVNATATLTVANLKTGIITSTSAAATDMTLPTGTLTEGGFSGIYTNMTFEWSVINTGPSLVRVLAGTDHTIVGSGSVATGTSGRFASRRTAANTFVTYRLS